MGCLAWTGDGIIAYSSIFTIPFQKGSTHDLVTKSIPSRHHSPRFELAGAYSLARKTPGRRPVSATPSADICSLTGWWFQHSWTYHQMEASKKWWYPNSWMVYNGKSYVKWMMTGGVPMSGNLQIYTSKKYLWYQHMCLQKMWHEPSISGLCGRENDKPWEGMVVWILRQPPLPKLNIIIYL